MDSKKVKEFIDSHVAAGVRQFTAADIEYCVNMAEQEAREGVSAPDSFDTSIDLINLRIMMVEAYRQTCPHRCDKLCTLSYESPDGNGDGHMDKCHARCEYIKRFTHGLGRLIRGTNY